MRQDDAIAAPIGWLCMALLGCWVLFFLRLPLQNRDLYWHLFFGRWMWIHRAVPRYEFLSFTEAGRPWIDFEWLGEAALYGLHHLGGCAGLVFFRAACLLLAGIATARTLALHGLSAAGRALGICALFAAVATLSDLRIDNISLALFAVTVYRLESLRLNAAALRTRDLLAMACLFALWANCHLGLVYGLLLMGFYAVGSALPLEQGRIAFKPRRAAPYVTLGLACAAATLANPYGLRLYSVLFEHLRTMRQLQQNNFEWMGIDASRPSFWPYAALVPLCFFLALRQLMATGSLPLPLTLASAFFALAASAHSRHVTFFALVAAVPACAAALVDPRVIGPRARARGAGACLGAIALFFLVCARPLMRPFGSDLCYIPAGYGTATFLRREAAVLGRLRLYHPSDYGGHWEAVLPAPYRIFSDGRYIFQDLLTEQAAAMKRPAAWADFLAKYGIEAACLPRQSVTTDWELVGKRRLPRPFYRRFMPQGRWALVYWDDEDLFFVRRDAVSSRWLSRREYRWFRPDDDAWLAAAKALKRIPELSLSREVERHNRETAL